VSADARSLLVVHHTPSRKAQPEAVLGCPARPIQFLKVKKIGFIHHSDYPKKLLAHKHRRAVNVIESYPRCFMTREKTSAPTRVELAAYNVDASWFPIVM